MSFPTIKLFGRELIWAEIRVGFGLQLCFGYVLQLWCVPLGMICGLLWALGGASESNKLFRRVGVPASAGAASIIKGYVLQGIIGAILAGASIWIVGYGKQSWLYQYFFKFNGDPSLSDYQTRVTTYVLYLGSWIIAFMF